MSEKVQAYGVQVTFKYGQTMINVPAADMADLTIKLQGLTGEMLPDDGDLIDFVADISNALHEREKAAGLLDFNRFGGGGNRGSGGGAPSGGSGGRPQGLPAVPASDVTYWVDRDRVNGPNDLPYAKGTEGPQCGACGAKTTMQWTNPVRKEGLTHGKSWAVWQCSAQNGRGHGEFYKA